MLRILVVDDHAVVRAGVKNILEDHFQPVVIGEADSGAAALEMLSQPWDVVLLDISLGQRNGFVFLKEIRELKPELPVVILTIHDEAEYARRAFRAGAAGYVTKNSHPQELIHGVQRVLQGGRFASANVAEQLLESGQPPRHEELSSREFEVMLLLAAGKTNEEVAEQLVISTKTVATYRSRIMDKLGLKSNAALVHYAILHRLIP